MVRNNLFTIPRLLVLLAISVLVTLPAQAAIYVANTIGFSVPAWPNSATGNVAPTTDIVGAATTLLEPIGIALYAGFIYVANSGNDRVLVFPIGADGNVAPTRSIVGGATTFNDPLGIAVSADSLNIIPTLSEWGLLVLFVLLAVLGAAQFRQRHVTTNY